VTFAERALYHQIHPAKLFADISTAVVGLDLFWRHELAPGLIIALLPPVLVSAVLLREADLERYRSSPMGPTSGASCLRGSKPFGCSAWASRFTRRGTTSLQAWSAGSHSSRSAGPTASAGTPDQDARFRRSSLFF